mmetsp:Transcript_33149/g.53258  ORF Transcript_33149/g.53258 Transcript_33149/m.53258 type:complete len:270 (+) Transcript_33149:278-1087(+)
MTICIWLCNIICHCINLLHPVPQVESIDPHKLAALFQHGHGRPCQLQLQSNPQSHRAGAHHRHRLSSQWFGLVVLLLQLRVKELPHLLRLPGQTWQALDLLVGQSLWAVAGASLILVQLHTLQQVPETFRDLGHGARVHEVLQRGRALFQAGGHFRRLRVASLNLLACRCLALRGKVHRFGCLLDLHLGHRSAWLRCKGGLRRRRGVRRCWFRSGGLRRRRCHRGVHAGFGQRLLGTKDLLCSLHDASQQVHLLQRQRLILHLRDSQGG